MAKSSSITDQEQPKPYWNPYVAGVALGLVLTLTFYLMGELFSFFTYRPCQSAEKPAFIRHSVSQSRGMACHPV